MRFREIKDKNISCLKPYIYRTPNNRESSKIDKYSKINAKNQFNKKFLTNEVDSKGGGREGDVSVSVSDLCLLAPKKI